MQETGNTRTGGKHLLWFVLAALLVLAVPASNVFAGGNNGQTNVPRPGGKPIRPLNDAFLALEPEAGAPPNGGTVAVGSRFVLDLVLHGASHPDLTAQQTYMTFTYQLLQNASVPNIPTTCITSTTVTADPTIFDATLQNEVCNGPGPCIFRGVTVDPGSFAFASGALNNCPTGCGGTFRVAQTGWCAIAPGTAIIHYQFSPPAPNTRDTEIIDFNSNTVSNPALFTDYVINITGGGGTPTGTSTTGTTNTPTRTNTVVSTNTATHTNTPANTVTSTATATNTAVNTSTNTATRTNTAVNTATNTVVSTATNSSTSTNTPLITSTASSSATSTGTAVNTSTNTATRTNTAVNTATNTVTGTATGAATNTGTSTATRTNTAVNTATNTAVNTMTNTATRTGTSAVSNTATRTSTSTNTSTATMTRTAVVSTTATRTTTPCSVCNTYIADVNISCNPDGTVHYSILFRNNGDCTVTTPYEVQLQVRPNAHARFHTVTSVTGTATLPPGDTLVEGDICYEFHPGQADMRLYVKETSAQRRCNADYISPFIDVCDSPDSCPSGPAYSDVKLSNPNYDSITSLAETGAISGYADGTFRPNSSATRAEIAKVVTVAFGISTDSISSSHFSDVSRKDAFYPYIEAAYSKGIIAGYSSGTYRPYTAVTRGEAAKIIVVASGLKLVSPNSSSFKDVPASSPYYKYIETGVANGLFSAGGNFAPNAEASRGFVCDITLSASTPQSALNPRHQAEK